MSLRKKKSFKNPVTLVISVILILGLIGIGQTFIPFNFPYRVDKVKSLLNTIYADNTRVNLSDNVSIFEVQDALNLTDKLAGDLKKTYRGEALMAYEKYRNLNKVLTVTNASKRGIELDQTDQVTIAPDLSDEVWNKNKELIRWTREDRLTKTIDKVMNKAKEEWKVLKAIRQETDQLPTNLAKQNQQISADLHKFVKVKGEMASLNALPQIKKLNQVVQQRFDAYIKAMEAQQAKTPYDPSLLKEMYMNDVILERIKGTPLDDRPRVALSFDDGPNDTYTPQVLDILDQYHIKATFFMVGRQVEYFPEMAKEVHDRGHEIGNHSYSHSSFAGMNDKGIRWEIDTTNQLIQDATGYKPKYYRMPFGDGGKHVYDLLSDMESIMWNVDSYDWGLKTPQEIMDYTTPLLDDEIIVLMHDTSQKSVDALKLLIPELEKRRYIFVGVGDIDLDYKYRTY